MSTAGFIELADPASGLHAWAGSGLPGLAPGQVLLLVSEGEGPLTPAVTEEGSLEVDCSGAQLKAVAPGIALEADVTAEGEGLRTGTASVKLSGDGPERSVEAAAAFAEMPPEDGAESGLVRAIDAIAPETGMAIAARSARPAKAANHEAEHLAAWLLTDSEESREVSEPLLSTQYDESGAQSRAGLELWVGSSDQAPLRVAGVRRADAEIELADGWRLHAALFRWLLDGAEADGSYLIWRRADG